MKFLILNVLIGLIAAAGAWLATRPTAPCNRDRIDRESRSPRTACRASRSMRPSRRG